MYCHKKIRCTYVNMLDPVKTFFFFFFCLKHKIMGNFSLFYRNPIVLTITFFYFYFFTTNNVISVPDHCDEHMKIILSARNTHNWSGMRSAADLQQFAVLRACNYALSVI